MLNGCGAQPQRGATLAKERLAQLWVEASLLLGSPYAPWPPPWTVCPTGSFSQSSATIPSETWLSPKGW